MATIILLKQNKRVERYVEGYVEGYVERIEITIVGHPMVI